jgi:hypothetical protein
MAQIAEPPPDSDVAAGVWIAGCVWIPLEHVMRLQPRSREAIPHLG